MPTESHQRVLMIAYACNPEGGGEHWLGWGWAEQAAKQFDVHLITTPNARAQIEKHAPAHGITPHFVEQPNAGRWRRKILWQSRVAKYASDLHGREKFQIVHQTTFHTFRVPFRAAGLNIPSVWGPIAGGESVPPGFEKDLGKERWSELARKALNRLSLLQPSVRRSLAQAHAIFVSNQTTLNFLPPACHGKCVIVPPNALRPEEQHLPETRVREDSRPFQLLYVGNCVATRALPIVFDALRDSRLEKEDVKLTIVGSGPALPMWERRVNEHGLKQKVEFAGQVSRDKLPEFYGRAHVLVFPALRDSGGSALLEAMARGLPVICLDWGGPGEMVDARSGVKIPVQHREETVRKMAAAIMRLHSAQTRAELAQAARDRALKLFRWEAKGALLASTYQRLLGLK